MGKGSRERNYDRVYEIMNGIMGFNVRDAGWNMHHVVFISDVKRNPKLWRGFDVHALSNLFPMPRREHAELHQTVSQGGASRRVALASVFGEPKTVDKPIRKKSWGADRQRVRAELKRYRGALVDLNNLQVREFIYS